MSLSTVKAPLVVAVILLTAGLIPYGFCATKPMETTEPLPDWMAVSSYYACALPNNRTLHIYQPRMHYTHPTSGPKHDFTTSCQSESSGSRYRSMNLISKDQALEGGCLDKAFDEFARHAGTKNLLLPPHDLAVIDLKARITVPSFGGGGDGGPSFHYLYSVLSPRVVLFTPTAYLQPGDDQFRDGTPSAQTRYVCALETVSKVVQSVKMTLWVTRGITHDIDNRRRCGKGLNRYQRNSAVSYADLAAFVRSTFNLYYVDRRLNVPVSIFLCGIGMFSYSCLFYFYFLFYF
eukprot:scpid84219/ scgid3568/ 